MSQALGNKLGPVFYSAHNYYFRKLILNKKCNKIIQESTKKTCHGWKKNVLIFKTDLNTIINGKANKRKKINYVTSFT